MIKISDVRFRIYVPGEYDCLYLGACPCRGTRLSAYTAQALITGRYSLLSLARHFCKLNPYPINPYSSGLTRTSGLSDYLFTILFNTNKFNAFLLMPVMLFWYMFTSLS